MNIGIVTLGCDKNIVDAEHLAGVLENRGHDVAGEGRAEALDVLVVYTCGFIEAAREETIGAVLAYVEAKQQHGNPRRLVMVGCLTQRWGAELQAELPQVDAFAGVGDPRGLADLVERVGASPANGDGAKTLAAESAARIAAPHMGVVEPLPRRLLGAEPSAFLKIADGCNHSCTFCAIPGMKGPYVSVPPAYLLDEARALIDQGVRELNLIAQDTAPYGRDLPEPTNLPAFLRSLCALDGDFRVRLLYFYPSGLTPEFIETFAAEPRICKYLDMPIQHTDPDVLRAMHRPDPAGPLAERLSELRRAAPEVALRTTIIVGFPGETSRAFKNLLADLREMRFDWLGGYVFSPEEGTPAASLQGAVDPQTAERRLDRLMQSQAGITSAILAGLVGRTLDVLVEDVDPEEQVAAGRSFREAPNVDGQVLIDLEGLKSSALPRVGDMLAVKVTAADTYDLHGCPARAD